MVRLFIQYKQMDWGRLEGIVILAHCKFHFIREHLVKHPSNNKSIFQRCGERKVNCRTGPCQEVLRNICDDLGQCETKLSLQCSQQGLFLLSVAYLNSIYLSIQYGSQSDAFPLDQNKLSAIHFWTNSRFVVPEGDKAQALTNLS